MKSGLLLNYCHLYISASFSVHLVEGGDAVPNDETGYIFANSIDDTSDAIAMIKPAVL